MFAFADGWIVVVGGMMTFVANGGGGTGLSGSGAGGNIVFYHFYA